MEMGPRNDSQAKKGLLAKRMGSGWSLTARRKVVLVALFSLIAFFSWLDMVTSIVAYGQGLAEGNSILLGSSQFLKVSVFNALAGSKIAFVIGMGVVVLIGARSSNSLMRKLAFATLTSFVLIFALVTLNNLAALGIV